MPTFTGTEKSDGSLLVEFFANREQEIWQERKLKTQVRHQYDEDQYIPRMSEGIHSPTAPRPPVFDCRTKYAGKLLWCSEIIRATTSEDTGLNVSSTRGRAPGSANPLSANSVREMFSETNFYFVFNAAVNPNKPLRPV